MVCDGVYDLPQIRHDHIFLPIYFLRTTQSLDAI